MAVCQIQKHVSGHGDVEPIEYIEYSAVRWCRLKN